MVSHRIDEEIIELTLPGLAPAEARLLQDRLAVLQRRKLAAIIARVCDECSPAGRLDRLDRVEVDLGRFALEDLDDELPARFEVALREALRRAIEEQEEHHEQSDREPATGSALELIETYAWTGTLPWWVDAGSEGERRASLRAALDSLAAHPDPQGLLRRALAELPSSPPALIRLLRIADDELLTALLGRVADPGSRGSALARLLASLLSQASAGVVDRPRLREELWLLAFS
ncbi:MAG: hypothetical protein KC457_09535, partial [Myxococcales bacterium]|nr:hypothetical protein [Myxococcales bacterium]